MTSLGEAASSHAARADAQHADAEPALAVDPPGRQWMVAALSPGLAIGLLLVVLALSRRGLELMDESYVLRLVTQPEASRPAGEVYLFPFLVHPLLQAAGGDIAAFRVLGTVLVAASAALASREVVLWTAPEVRTRWLLMMSVLPAAAASTGVFTLGVRVLGYRSLALMGLLLLTAGMARQFRGYRLSGGLLLGCGLWLTFVGKPTSALAAGALTGVLLLGQPVKLRFVTGVLVGAIASLGATLWLADMTPLQAFQYLRGGASLVGSLGDHPSIWAMLGIGPVYLAALIVFGIPLMAFVLIGLRLLARSEPRLRALLGLMLELALAAIALVAAVLLNFLDPPSQGMQSLPLYLVIPLLTVIILFPGSFRALDQRRHRRFVVFLLVLPWAFAVGSNVSLAFTTCQAAVIWTIALGAVAGSPRYRAAREAWFSHYALLMTTCVCITAIVLYANYADATDTPDLSRATQRVQVANGDLELNPTDAAIARGLRQIATEHGITSRTPVLDLTGMGAGYAYILGGRPLGRAHLYGTWSGGVDSARLALSAESCADVSAAWVLYTSSNSWDVSKALKRFNTDRAEHYQVVFKFDATRYGRLRHFELFQPLTEPTGVASC